LGGNGARNAPSDGTIVGDAHDETAFASHEIACRHAVSCSWFSHELPNSLSLSV